MTHDDPLGGLGPPPLPEHLRVGVLRAARAALLAAPRRSAWERAWSHPGLRLGWAAACLVLVAAHLLLGRLPLPPALARVTPAPAARVPAQPRELRDVLHLVPIEALAEIPGESSAATSPDPDPVSSPRPGHESINVNRKG